MLESGARNRSFAAPESKPQLRCARKETAASLRPKGRRPVTFLDVETTQQTPVNLTRTKRQLAEQATAQASSAQWDEAAETNRKLLELGLDPEAENRLAKAL